MIVDSTLTSYYNWNKFGGGAIYADNADMSLTTVAMPHNPVNDRVIGEATVAGAQFSALGVYHGNANKIYAKISLDGSVDVSAYTATVNGVAATIEATDAAGIYIVYTDDIKVTDFDEIYTIALTYGENTQTVTYSVNAYAAIKADSGKTDVMKDLAKALYNYGASAEAYIAG